MHLFCGDDGQVHRAGTTEYVASFSQGGATGSNDVDDALIEALDAALDEAQRGEAQEKGAKKRR